MKKMIKAIVISAFFAGSALVSCNSSSDKKVENAREDVNEAKKDLKEAKQDYAQEIQQYKNEQAQRLNENEKQIAEYRVKVKNDKVVVREKREKRIAELERENKELRVKLDTYNDNDPNNWQRFKSEFNQSMDHLGQSFKNLFDDNNPND